MAWESSLTDNMHSSIILWTDCRNFLCQFLIRFGFRQFNVDQNALQMPAQAPMFETQGRQRNRNQNVKIGPTRRNPHRKARKIWPKVTPAPQESDSETEPQSVIISCPICMNSMVNRTPVTTVCGHLYCMACITKALKTKKECPMCKTILRYKKLIKIFLQTAGNVAICKSEKCPSSDH